MCLTKFQDSKKFVFLDFGKSKTNFLMSFSSEVVRKSKCALLFSLSTEDVSVRYAVVFNGETELGDDPEIVEEQDEDGSEDVNAPKLKHIIVKALEQEPSLPLDIQTLSFEAGEHTLSTYLIDLCETV